MRTDGLATQVACRVLGVSESGFYARVVPPAVSPLASATPGLPTSSVTSMNSHAAPMGHRGCTPN